jgi:hypothetical protein
MYKPSLVVGVSWNERGTRSFRRLLCVCLYSSCVSNWGNVMMMIMVTVGVYMERKNFLLYI